MSERADVYLALELIGAVEDIRDGIRHNYHQIGGAALVADNGDIVFQSAHDSTCRGCIAFCISRIVSELAEPVRIGDIGSSGQAHRVYSVHGKSIALSTGQGGQGSGTGLYKIDLPDGDYIIRKLSPLECERLQTLPDGYTDCVSNAQRYKCLGNGRTVDVIAHILHFLPNS